jgi:hypothetical protein
MVADGTLIEEPRHAYRINPHIGGSDDDE